MTAAAPPGTRPLYELIYDVLKEHLLDGSLPAGLVFGETTVARAFGSSRIPAAAALQRLRAEGLLKPFAGRGLLAADADPRDLLRKELVDAGLRLPDSVIGNLEVRNHHGRIYPLVEHAVAASLAYGRFLVNESALGEHYGVSRTVAHEVLTRLERTGLIAQDRNQRWYAGPLAVDRLRDHFEMRWLLEPVALGQAMETLAPADIDKRRAHLEKARAQRLTPPRLERLETELHVDTVLACNNAQLRDAIRRNQLPLIPTHSTFAALPHRQEIETMLAEHAIIFEHIASGARKRAMQALEAHVRRSLEPNIELLESVGPLPEALRPPFLILVEPPRR